MTTVERYERLRGNVDRLKRNRDAVPLEQLRTKYGQQFKALCGSVISDADWYARECVMSLIDEFPKPKDQAEREAVQKEVDRLLAEGRNRGGARDAALAELIDRQDFDAFVYEIWKRYERIEREVLLPYFRKHSWKVGGSVFIYNDLLDAYWKRDQEWPEGIWMGRDGRKWVGVWAPDDGDSADG